MDEWNLFIGFVGVLYIPIMTHECKSRVCILKWTEGCEKFVGRKEMFLKYISEKNMYQSITTYWFRAWDFWGRDYEDVGSILLALLLGNSGKAS